MNDFNQVSLDTITKTPRTYRDRITFEFGLHGTCVLLNFCLCLFFLNRPKLLKSFKSTICFVTIGTFILSLPLFLLQLYLVFELWWGNEPEFTIAECTFVKCFTSATTSCAQVLPLPVAIYRYFIVVRNRKLPFVFVVSVHIIICSFFLLICYLNFPLGEFEPNDQCEILKFSKTMEALRISFTLGLNLFAVFINIVIYRFVKKYDKRNVDVHRRRVQLTYSMLLQSTIPILVSTPLLVGSLNFYFGYNLPSQFTTRWYATTFLSPFLTPFSSMLSLRTIRQDLLTAFLFSCILRNTRKISTLITLKGAIKNNPGTQQSSDYSSA